MKSSVTHAEIFVIVARLNPAAFDSRIHEWRRGGLPSSSIPEGSRSAETPIPKSDRIDQQLLRAAKNHRRLLDEALKRLREVERLELTIACLPAAEAAKLAAEEAAPKAQACKNCKRLVERTPADRLRGGECHACYEWRKAHGDARPKHLWESEIERRAAELAHRSIDPKGRVPA